VTERAPWTPRPVPVPRRQLARPYNDAELASLWGDARAQPTAKRKRAAIAMLLLGRGAGLDGRWVSKVRARDVERRDGFVMVRVDEPSARTVVVRAEFEAPLVELTEEARDEFLVGGNSTSRNRTGHLVSQLVVPTAHPALAPARLRSTWLVSHLHSGTRLPELCQAAGVKGTGLFGELLEFVSAMSADEARTMLRQGPP